MSSFFAGVLGRALGHHVCNSSKVPSFFSHGFLLHHIRCKKMTTECVFVGILLLLGTFAVWNVQGNCRTFKCGMHRVNSEVQFSNFRPIMCSHK